MSDSDKALLEGLFQAIKAEVEGQHFYLMAARSSEDPKGREIFELLASEELDHQRFLKSQYQSLLETGRVDPDVKLGPRAPLSDESPIFSAEIKGRAKEAHFEMSALSIGIQLELSAMSFYREAARAAEDPAVKAFYEELAEWEDGHYRALLRQQEALREDYWSAGGFSPF